MFMKQWFAWSCPDGARAVAGLQTLHSPAVRATAPQAPLVLALLLSYPGLVPLLPCSCPAPAPFLPRSYPAPGDTHPLHTTVCS